MFGRRLLFFQFIYDDISIIHFCYSHIIVSLANRSNWVASNSFCCHFICSTRSTRLTRIDIKENVALVSWFCMDILDGCAVARKIKSYSVLSDPLAFKGVFNMCLGPSAVKTVGSLFCGDNLDKSVSKIINNVVDRAWLVPELAGIFRVYPGICIKEDCIDRNASLCLE